MIRIKAEVFVFLLLSCSYIYFFNKKRCVTNIFNDEMLLHNSSQFSNISWLLSNSVHNTIDVKALKDIQEILFLISNDFFLYLIFLWILKQIMFHSWKDKKLWHRILSSSWVRLSYFNWVGVGKCVVIVIVILNVHMYSCSL